MKSGLDTIPIFLLEDLLSNIPYPAVLLLQKKGMCQQRKALANSLLLQARLFNSVYIRSSCVRSPWRLASESNLKFRRQQSSVLRICISKSKGGQVGYSFPISLYPLQPFYNDPFSMPFFLFSSFTFDYCQNKGLFM